jgi:hypothetical protein
MVTVPPRGSTLSTLLMTPMAAFQTSGRSGYTKNLRGIQAQELRVFRYSLGSSDESNSGPNFYMGGVVTTMMNTMPYMLPLSLKINPVESPTELGTGHGGA